MKLLATVQQWAASDHEAEFSWVFFFNQNLLCCFTVKLSSEPKSFFRELSREVAREARNINIMKRDTEKSQQRPETPRHRGEMEYAHTLVLKQS